jgi:hypothetical protein
MEADKLPAEIFSSLNWSFVGGRYDDVNQFVKEINEYLADVEAAPWDPEAVVLPVPRVTVSYRNDSASGEGLVELSSENGQAFTARDLLFQIHNAIVEEVEDLDHHFFEGLRLNSIPVGDAPPLYVLRLGS